MRVNLKAPAEADIQRRFGVTPPSVHQMVLALELDGLIRRLPRARAASRCCPTSKIYPS